MEWAMLVITAVASLAAVGSAAVAVIEARSAARSRRYSEKSRDQAVEALDESIRLAEEANQLRAKLAAAQERANALREEERRPAYWTGPRWISGDLYAITNTSGRKIHLQSVDVQPDESVRMIRIHGQRDGLYDLGDSIEYVSSKRLPNRPRKLTLTWNFADEPVESSRETIIPL